MRKGMLIALVLVGVLLIGGGGGGLYEITAAITNGPSTPQTVSAGVHVAQTETQTPREYVMIPAEIVWNGQSYRVIGGLVKQVGPKLGTATCGHGCTREVYQVQGSDPQREVAIRQTPDAYFKAVHLTQEEKQTLIKKNLLQEMRNYIQLKQSKKLSASDEAYYPRLFREEMDRITDGERVKYEAIAELIKQGQFGQALHQIEQLEKSLPPMNF